MPYQHRVLSGEVIVLSEVYRELCAIYVTHFCIYRYHIEGDPGAPVL